MNVFARLIRVLLVVVLASASPVATAHDEDDGHEHAHGPVVQPRNFDHAVDLVREGLERLGAAVQRSDMHALHELSDGVVVPARAFGKLAAARPGAAPANIRAINTLGQDIATLVDAMHVAADSSKADVVVAKWKEIEVLVPQLDSVSPRPRLIVSRVDSQRSALRTHSTLTLSVRNSDGTVAKEFVGVNGASMHLFTVADGYPFFAHQTSDTHTDGAFKFEVDFPYAGDFALFAVCQPVGSPAPLTLREPFGVGGSTPDMQGITLDQEPSKLVNGYLVRATFPEHIHASDPVVITYRIDEQAAPGGVTTEPLLGMPAFFSAASKDARTLITGASVARVDSGEIRVEATFPHTGLFCTWLEFKHAGKVITVPFVISVHDAE